MNLTYQKMLETVKNFVSIKLGIPKQEVNEDTRIEEDFGIAGLDTITFYKEFLMNFRLLIQKILMLVAM